MTARAFLGLSHTPLMGLNEIPASVELPLKDAIATARDLSIAFAPELIVVIGPDHYNGFFNELMPPFCIGTQATGVGDYLSPAGPLNVEEDLALGLADYLMETGFDMAVSRRMRVDHGFTQPLQLIWGGLDSPPVIPLFVNAVAAPGIPRVRRCHDLGKAIGTFLNAVPQRTLLIGSGGLSHEPPVPTLANPDPAVRERITVRREATAAELETKKQRVMAAGRALAAGHSAMKPLNPAWDQRWMDAIAGDEASVASLRDMSEDSIEREGGFSAHESKNWLIGRAALGAGAVHCGLRHYQAIPDYIAGFGAMWLTPRE